MNRTKTIYFLSAFVLIIGCYALNLSYSLFTQTVTPENNTVDATVPYLSASLETNTFTIPANDSKVITLNIINSGTSDINYGISVSDTKGTTIQLVETYNITGKLAAPTIEGETTSKEVLVYVTNPTDTKITDLTFNLTSNYTTIAFNEDSFIDSSNIDSVNTIKLLNNTLIARAKSITETDSKTSGYAMYSETLRTTPAEEISAADESLLLTTEDDYTETTGNPSYYFRGNVKDNYVNYAGMCWRIVRIEGDGSVKLLLEDTTYECDNSLFTGNWSDGNKYVFGYDSNNRADFVNYTGGLADSFESFQTSKLTSTDIEKLKVDEWCYDDNVTSTDSYGNEYYGAYTRIYKNKKPSLKCSGTKITKFNDENETDMYVGTLTADEMSFAGAYSSKNYNYYLVNTYAKNYYLYWWSLSPGLFNEGIGFGDAFYLHGDGYLSGGYVDFDVYSRPAVLLKSGSVITGGVGTLEKPYIIG